MKIIAMSRLKPGTGFAQIKPHLPDEAKAVWAQYSKGVYRELYFRQETSDIVFVLECADVDEARQQMSELPLVKEDLIEIELIPLRPFNILPTQQE